jgi:hypothetical protein
VSSKAILNMMTVKIYVVHVVFVLHFIIAFCGVVNCGISEVWEILRCISSQIFSTSVMVGI